MDIRHLATKSFDCIESTKSVVYNGVPICVKISSEDKSEKITTTISLLNNVPDKISMSESLNRGLKHIVNDCPIAGILVKDNSMLPLSQLFGYSVDAEDDLSAFLPLGTTFNLLLGNDEVKEFFRDTAVQMFTGRDKVTDELELRKNTFYTEYIPLVILTGVMTPQLDEFDREYFNPSGTVSVAEFLDSLNSIKFGCNSNRNRKKTLDNVSDENDYFNEGYQECLRGISSPFFNLYTREELTKPITRAELAYLTVICWTRFLEKYNSLYGGNFFLGVNFDWENPAECLRNFSDGFDYKISRVVLDEKYGVVSLDIKDYKTSSMTEFKYAMKNGISAIPIPMYMSLVELSILNMFKFEDNRLDPMKEVSRGELCYFVTMLAKLFPLTYIK